MSTESESKDSSTITENLLVRTPIRISGKESEISSSTAVTSEEVVQQLKAATDPRTQEVARLTEFLHQLNDEQSNKRL